MMSMTASCENYRCLNLLPHSHSRTLSPAFSERSYSCAVASDKITRRVIGYSDTGVNLHVIIHLEGGWVERVGERVVG